MMREPKWLEWARSQIGVAEVAGPGDNPKVVQYFRLAGLHGAPFNDDETPWCAAFVGAALAITGFTGTNSAAARSYENWKNGKRIEFPVLGAIAVLNRNPPKPGLGHVAFVVGASKAEVALLGGNQRDMVCVNRFPRSRVICYQWPKNELIHSDWMNPPLDPKASLGGSVV